MKKAGHPRLDATITKTPFKCDVYYTVKTDAGEVMHLQGVGAPIGGRVGDRGTVQYRSGASYGLYFWRPIYVTD